MSNPTNPFSWQMPENTDLVTDLPADFEVFGQAVATSMQDLLGGTTGQVLAKASNTDMDFVWSADAAGMTNPMTTTGDSIYSSSGSTPARLGIGSTGQVLTVAAGVPSWATSGGGMTLLASGSVAASSTGFDLTGISGSYEELKLKVMDIDLNASTLIRFRFNSDASGAYWSYLIGNENATAVTDASNGGTSIGLQYETFPTTANGATVILNLPNYSDSIGYKQFRAQSGYESSTGTNTNVWRTGFWKNENAITGISLTTSSSSFDSGATYELWGIK